MVYIAACFCNLIPGWGFEASKHGSSSEINQRQPPGEPEVWHGRGHRLKAEYSFVPVETC